MTELKARADRAFPTETITGYPFSTRTLDETVQLLSSWLQGAPHDTVHPRPAARFFVCANPHSLELARKDPVLHEAIMAADLVTPDGAGIVLASRLLAGWIPERVCGPDLFPAFCAHLNAVRPGTRMFFLGSTEENLVALERRFRTDYPTLDFRGTLSPPFRTEFSSDENNALIERVNASQAEILWLGLGAPKQEKWAYRHRERLKIDLIGPIGGAFDWYTGRIALPPLWMQRGGLQWLHRLAQEPRRL
ncbi:MAG: WecB/TagA/CpsF family glycosyltransferase, partial [Gammaproteobacteria bacterium]|nr:WecB/TagA/CpsF family glycosyltransferase [Gammaproteobacteria bacterium]